MADMDHFLNKMTRWFGRVVPGRDDGAIVPYVAVADADLDGTPIPPNLPVTYTEDGSGNIDTMTKTDGVNTWVRTLTYFASGNIETDSGWVKQP